MTDERINAHIRDLERRATALASLQSEVLAVTEDMKLLEAELDEFGMGGSADGLEALASRLLAAVGEEE